jgi:hypothetical protein
MSTSLSRWDELAGLGESGNYPSEEDRERLLDEYFFQRAVQVYLTALPAVNVIAMRDASERAFGRGYNVLPVWKKRMDAKCKVTTPNADVVYAMSYLDLAESGPLVVSVPAGIMGMLLDFWQRCLSDVGFVGPDKGQGGQYLLLPPHYDGPPVPGGYYVLRSRTQKVFLFWRAFLTRGDGGPDPAQAVAAIEQTLIYPLRNSNPATWPPMDFPDASGVPIDMLFPRDGSYFELLAKFIDEEPTDSVDMTLRGMMASIGIIKGQPFAPSDHHREILQHAAEVAPRLADALVISPDAFPGRGTTPVRSSGAGSTLSPTWTRTSTAPPTSTSNSRPPTSSSPIRPARPWPRALSAAARNTRVPSGTPTATT